jgi:hypothetical protein
MKLFHAAVAKLTGKNLQSTPKEVIIEQMNEPRALPMGRKDFEEWADRIISGALIPGGSDDPDVFVESQKFTLANMLLHLGPTESHKPDAHFIHSLRKFAINQVADTVRKELHEEAKARTQAEEKAKLEKAQRMNEQEAVQGAPSPVV